MIGSDIETKIYCLLQNKNGSFVNVYTSNPENLNVQFQVYIFIKLTVYIFCLIKIVINQF